MFLHSNRHHKRSRSHFGAGGGHPRLAGRKPGHTFFHDFALAANQRDPRMQDARLESSQGIRPVYCGQLVAKRAKCRHHKRGAHAAFSC